MSVALITGGSRGLGRALTLALAGRGWSVIVDGRDRQALDAVAAQLPDAVSAVRGDVADADHREALVRAVQERGAIDLLVNNASELGASPLPQLDAMPLAVLQRVLSVNVLAPMSLTQQLLPLMRDGAAVVNISSDASVEAYAGWGGYGASKAALDQLTAVFAAEHPELRWYAFDPGDMRTAMHQAAYPGEDISDRPEPETVVPALLRLLDERPPSGRYRKEQLLAPASTTQ
ncbi:MAG: SDR family oxidoreductase [Candidatus Dormibacteraeota bacterium]|nr:SDR family oxidoreductase [Candidatus Dormibacteraeota bacterium]MBV9526619.1 SDR family oxidoreductase [Candidatus Dormibacteraeota bacterium]